MRIINNSKSFCASFLCDFFNLKFDMLKIHRKYGQNTVVLIFFSIYRYMPVIVKALTMDSHEFENVAAAADKIVDAMISGLAR